MDTYSSIDDIKDYNRKNRTKSVIAVAVTLSLMIISFLICLSVGNYPVSIGEIIDILIYNKGDPGASMIIKDVRVPRLLCAAMVGAGLSVAGAAMQSLFKNPMASPSVLGLSSGAAFGASIAISFGIGTAIFGNYATPMMAFVFCLLTMGLVYLIARSKYGISTVTLLLAGVAIGAFFNGLVSLLQYIADDDILSAIVYWTMGSFNKCTWDSFTRSVLPIMLGVLALLFIYRELNLISAGEDQAANLGVNVKMIRLIAIISTSLCVGGAVSAAGTIGFVGLIVPHMLRMIFGPNHKLLMPLCVFGGATFLMVIDTIAKTAFTMSFPVGIFTALLGAPFFIMILNRLKKEIWE